jgi:protocatechuate 3,4-dioxygenase beta subunit
MENDDRQIGRILSRRDVLKLIGISGATFLVGCVPGLSGATESTSPTQLAVPSSTPAGTTGPTAVSAAAASPMPACVVRPELTEGPYYVDEELNRSDVRSDPASGTVKEGVPLVLTFNVSQIGSGGCAPLEGAKVEIWHCDADGVYSDVSDRGSSTNGQKFLRGFQMTDANGQATFVSIYPGWYPGRTVHIHFKVHHDTAAQSSVFTSQLFFDDSLSDKVFAQEPYASRGQRNILNRSDNIYKDELLLKVAETANGYTAEFDIGLQTG